MQRWYIADPANPARPPTEVAYPAAGTANAEVTLVLVGLDGSHIPVDWDQVAYPYLATVCWEQTAGGGPLFVVQDRTQRQMRILRADAATGRCELVHAASDDAWLDIVPGVPAWTAAGDLVWTGDADGARRLFVAPPAALASAPPVTPADLQVRWVLDVDGETVLFAASQDPTEIHLWTYGPGGLGRLTSEPGVYAGRRAGGTTVIAQRTLREVSPRVRVLRRGRRRRGGVSGHRDHLIRGPPERRRARARAACRGLTRGQDRGCAALVAPARFGQAARACSRPTAAPATRRCSPPAAPT